jgi:hypothetical protein
MTGRKVALHVDKITAGYVIFASQLDEAAISEDGFLTYKPDTRRSKNIK